MVYIWQNETRESQKCLSTINHKKKFALLTKKKTAICPAHPPQFVSYTARLTIIQKNYI